MGGQPTPFVNSFDNAVVGSLRYNTSQYGSPLPLCYGTQRISVNVLEFWGYSGGSSAKGGKGGGGGKAGGGGKKGSTNYSVYVALALCQGPVSFYGSIYGSDGNNRVWANAGIAYGIGSVGLNAYDGYDGQSPDPTFEASDPNQPVLGYSGTAYVTGTPMQLGQSPSLPNMSAEITGFGVGTIGSAFPNDARPDWIVEDFLTNDRYGAGFPAANLDTSVSLPNYGTYCEAFNYAMSILMANCQPASQWLDYILRLTVSTAFFSAGLLKIVPYPTVASTGSDGTLWEPNLTVEYSLADRDFIDWGGGSDPVIVTRTDPYMATNWLALEYYDTTNSYNPNIAYRFDQGAIDAYGLRNEPPMEGHCFTNISSAQASVEFQLQRKQQVRMKYKIQLGWTMALLDPMDVIELTDETAGLNATPVRIISIEENENGALTIECEELPNFPSEAPTFVEVIPSSQTPNLFVQSGNANPPFIFEPPAALSNGITEAWMIASGASNLWGGANIWVSYDGATFEQIGQVFHGGVQGVLTAELPAYSGANPDTGDTLSVDVTESLGQISSVSESVANSLLSLIIVDDEIMAFATSTLVSQYNYDLTYLMRGLYGTEAVEHAAGAPFAQINPLVFEWEFPPSLVGNTFYVKLQSFNIYGQNLQALDSVPVSAYTVTGNTISQDPDGVTGLTTTFLIGQLTATLMWNPVSDWRNVFYEIRLGTSWETAAFLGQTAATSFPTVGDGTYLVKSFVVPLQGIQVYSAAAASVEITGAVLTQNIVETYNEQALGWPGTVTGGGIVTIGGSEVIVTGGVGNILTVSSFLGLPDVLNYGGQGGTAFYTASQTISFGYLVSAPLLNITWAATAQSIYDNFLTIPSVLINTDILDYEAVIGASMQPMVASSTDGITFTSFMAYVGGTQAPAFAFQFAFQMTSPNIQTQCILEQLTVSVSIPARIDHYVNESVPSTGLTIVFEPDGASSAAAFNGGPQGSPDAPSVQGTILNAESGDTLVISSISLSQMTVEVKNGGSGVARTCNFEVEGY